MCVQKGGSRVGQNLRPTMHSTDMNRQSQTEAKATVRTIWSQTRKWQQIIKADLQRSPEVVQATWHKEHGNG